MGSASCMTCAFSERRLRDVVKLSHNINTPHSREKVIKASGPHGMECRFF
jgi:hypothetical protein